MGLFGGLLGGIFGGSDTTVTQQSSNSTDVTTTLNNEVSVTVDTEKIADAIKAVGEMSNSGQVLLAASFLQNAKVQAESEKEALGFAQEAWGQIKKYAVWITIIAGAWWLWPKRKRK